MSEPTTLIAVGTVATIAIALLAIVCGYLYKLLQLERETSAVWKDMFRVYSQRFGQELDKAVLKAETQAAQRDAMRDHIFQLCNDMAKPQPHRDCWRCMYRATCPAVNIRGKA
jgi:hypothetical protein